MRASSVLSLVLLLSGCANDFIEAYEVAEPRLMGVKVEVQDDVDNPRPHLGQSFSLRQYIAVPGPQSTPLQGRYAMALSLCLGFKTAIGTLACLDDQDLAPVLTPVSDTEVLLSGLHLDLSSLGLPAGPGKIDIASFPQLKDLDRLALFGVFCVDGTPERVPGKSVQKDAPSQVFRCTNNAAAKYPDPTTFTLSVFLDRGLATDANRNPAFACDPSTPDSPCFVGVQKDGEPMMGGAIVLVSPKPKQAGALRTVTAWPWLDPNTLPERGCASVPDLLQVHAGADAHIIRVRFDPSDRETYMEQISINGVPSMRAQRESLDLTSALTIKGGELGEFESLILGSELDAKGQISVSYTPPKQSADPLANIPQDGRLVRFYFTLRDQRGGLDYTQRALCLVPAADQQ